MDNDWKQWTPANIGSESPQTIIKVLFADGIYGMPDTVHNWLNVQYAQAPITHYMIEVNK